MRRTNYNYHALFYYIVNSNTYIHTDKLRVSLVPSYFIPTNQVTRFLRSIGFFNVDESSLRHGRGKNRIHRDDDNRYVSLIFRRYPKVSYIDFNNLERYEIDFLLDYFKSRNIRPVLSMVEFSIDFMDPPYPLSKFLTDHLTLKYHRGSHRIYNPDYSKSLLNYERRPVSSTRYIGNTRHSRKSIRIYRRDLKRDSFIRPCLRLEIVLKGRSLNHYGFQIGQEQSLPLSRFIGFKRLDFPKLNQYLAKRNLPRYEPDHNIMLEHIEFLKSVDRKNYHRFMIDLPEFKPWLENTFIQWPV
jgi:hypothetical protein